MSSLDELKNTLKNSPAAKIKLVASGLRALEENGVDTNDPEVHKALGLEKIDFNSPSHEALAASTVIITIG